MKVYTNGNYFKELNDSILFSLYCELTNCTDVSEFVFKIKNYGINISLFVAFGIYKKILRRVHMYAYCKNRENIEGSDLGTIKLDIFFKYSRMKTLIDSLDGKHCLDQICSDTDLSLNEVVTLISMNKESYIIYK
jgi:hypothetical protein